MAAESSSAIPGVCLSRSREGCVWSVDNSGKHECCEAQGAGGRGLSRSPVSRLRGTRDPPRVGHSGLRREKPEEESGFLSGATSEPESLVGLEVGRRGR